MDEKSKDDPIALRFDHFSSVCPFDKLVDNGSVELTYAPGERRIDVDELQRFLSSFKNVEIPLELVAIEIAKRCIEKSVFLSPPSKWAAPEMIDIHTAFQSGSKKWGMRVRLKFEREILTEEEARVIPTR